MFANGLSTSQGAKSPQAALSTLARQFKVPAPNISWVTDITYIRTQEGWLYLAAVLDLFSRQGVGWAVKSHMTADLAVDALLMVVWRREPKQWVLVHSDQAQDYPTRDEAHSAVFDYIKIFYNRIRRHGSNDGLSLVEFERKFIFQQQSI